VQAASQLRPLLDVLYVPKWLSALAVVASFVLLGRDRLSTRLAVPFTLAVAVVAVGLLTQVGDGLDPRAFALATTFLLTAITAFVIGPQALARGWVRRAVWSGLLRGVSLGVVLGFAGGVLTLPAGLLFRDDKVRYFGLFNYPNIAGTIALTAVVLAGASSVAHRRLMPLLAILPMGSALALADARGATLAAAGFVSLSTFLWLWRHHPRTRQLLAAAVVAGVTFGAYKVVERGSPSRTDMEQFASGRLEAWGRSLAYLESPADWLFGVGLSRNHSFVGYTAAPTTESTKGLVGMRGAATDSTYVDLITRTGLVGLTLFLALVAFLAKRVWGGWDRGTRAADECAVALAALMAAMLHMLTDSTTFSFGLTLAFVVWPLAGGAAVRVALLARHSARPEV
jgi:O-antigen ligase